jgi:histidyl-tRNA synthetase
MQTARGVRDIPPEEKILKNQVVDTLKEVFKLYGFPPLETPTIERLETLSAKGGAGEESDALKETFKFQDQGKRKLALRFDLTVPLARFVTMNPNLKMPFKRYEMGSVFRDGPIKLGRTREFWQCDIDTVGTNSMLADAEVIAVISEGFNRLGLDVVIKVNNRKILTGILEQAGIKEKENAIIAIDKLDKIGKEGVCKELNERGYNKKQISAVFDIIDGKVTLTGLKTKVKNELGIQGMTELGELMNYLKRMKVQVKFDVSLARGLAYYTGTVFEVFLKKGEVTSSLAGGGRYDDMVGNFMGGGRVIPAVGGSFGIVPIMAALKKTVQRMSTKVFVLPINATEESLDVVQQLRTAGIPTSFALGKKGVSKNLEYANYLGIPFVIIIGENELQKKKVLFRDMITGTEQLLSLKDVVKKLRA